MEQRIDRGSSPHRIAGRGKKVPYDWLNVTERKMNFTEDEINRFKVSIKHKCLFGETKNGNIEFVIRDFVGSVVAKVYRLCKRKSDGKLYLCTDDGHNTVMFKNETFLTVEQVAKRFNRYTDRKIQ